MEISECVEERHFAEAWPLISQLRTSLSESEYQKRLAAAKAHGYRLFAAREGGVCVGVIGWRIGHNLVFGRYLYVDDLVIDESQRGKGYGQELLDFARTEAARENCSNLTLNSGFHRTDAHRFYELSGMTKTGFSFREPVVPLD
ncbi:MAG: GNAT family N-acetyltransferase [Bauldia sp.]|nr:GNAT family N-acetyltransferase [Bauldia sp.]